MGFGRPREHNLEEMAKELLEWAQKEDSLNLNGFSAKMMIAPSVIIQWTKVDEHFCKAYEIAKALLGQRRERKLSEGTLHVKAYDLNATNYDRFLKEEKMEYAKYESELAKATDTASEKDKENLSVAINTVNFLQSQSEANK
jgi:transposase